MNPYLLLWLEGPLQSWGHDSRFGRRETLPFPTKSGVMGILCAALGAGGEQTSLLEEFADLDMQVYAYGRRNTKGEAAPREPQLRDFHMVGSGYDDTDLWQSLLIPKTSEGKKAVGGGAKMTFRYYLQDCTFAVLFQIPAGQCDAVAHALQHPVWTLYLGRKNCIPTELIFQGVYQTSEQAKESAEKLAQAKQKCLAYTITQGTGHGEIITVNDVPIQFGAQKRYRDRQVTILAED